MSKKDWEKQFLIRLLEAGIQVASMADVIVVIKATEAYAKKQERERIVKWRNEECTEHKHTINISGVEHKMIVMHNDCEQCWQALKEEK